MPPRAAFHTSDEERKLRSRELGVVMRIELSCAECGNNRFNFPVGGNDASDVTCADCGHLVGTMGSLKDEVAKAVIDGDNTPSDAFEPRRY